MNATTEPTGTVLVDELRIQYADSGADSPVILLPLARKPARVPLSGGCPVMAGARGRR
jgi:hypothetical protein